MPRSGLKLTTSRLHSFIVTKVSQMALWGHFAGIRDTKEYVTMGISGYMPSSFSRWWYQIWADGRQEARLCTSSFKWTSRAIRSEATAGETGATFCTLRTLLTHCGHTCCVLSEGSRSISVTMNIILTRWCPVTVRECVEWEIGNVLQLFAFLSPVAKYYLVGGLLTGNCHTCLYGSQTSNYCTLLASDVMFKVCDQTGIVVIFVLINYIKKALDDT